MKIYVAGRFQEYARVREVIDSLTLLGHTVTYDWTRTAEFGSDGHPVGTDGSQEKSLLRSYAENDIQGVRDAEALVLCADASLAGAWVEFGIALERGIHILVVKPERWTIFLECASVRTLTHYQELPGALNELEGGPDAA